MNTVMPWLGGFGATCLRLLHIIDTFEAESLKIFTQKKQEMEKGDFSEDGPQDLLTTLRECYFDLLGNDAEMLQCGDRKLEAKIL